MIWTCLLGSESCRAGNLRSEFTHTTTEYSLACTCAEESCRVQPKPSLSPVLFGLLSGKSYEVVLDATLRGKTSFQLTLAASHRSWHKAFRISTLSLVFTITGLPCRCVVSVRESSAVADGGCSCPRMPALDTESSLAASPLPVSLCPVNPPGV